MSKPAPIDFDIARFEDRIEALMSAYQRLLAEHHALQAAMETEQQQNRAARDRLNGVIERIRALETQADSA